MKKKFIYLLLLLLSSPIVTYFFIWDSATVQKEQEVQKNLEITKATAIGINRQLVEIMNRDTRISKNESFLNPGQYLYLSKESMYVLDTTGKVIAQSTAATKPNGIKVPINRYLNLALEGKTLVTDLVKSPFSAHYVIAVYTPIIREGKITGVLVNELPPSYFKDALSSIQLGKSGKLALMDSEGYFIYSRSLDTSAKLSFSDCYRDNPGQAVSVVERASNKTGKKTLFTKVRLPVTGWYVVAFQSSSELGAPSDLLLLRNVAFLVVLALIWLILQGYHHSLNQNERLQEHQKAEKLALIGELAAGMAHEIRNPLTTIKGFTELLSDSYYNGDRSKVLDLIEESIGRIDDILTQSLLLAKPQKMRVTTINVQELIHHVHACLSAEALIQEIDFRYKPLATSIIVRGDVTHLRLLLFKLLNNSFEATAAKGKVIISTEVIDNYLYICIKDTGTGIQDEVLKKLGTPFFTTKPEGTGLGISVCQRIVHEHRGKLSFESQVGLGTTATVGLPCEVTTQVENRTCDSGLPTSKQLCIADSDCLPPQQTTNNEF